MSQVSGPDDSRHYGVAELGGVNVGFRARRVERTARTHGRERADRPDVSRFRPPWVPEKLIARAVLAKRTP